MCDVLVHACIFVVVSQVFEVPSALRCSCTHKKNGVSLKFGFRWSCIRETSKSSVLHTKPGVPLCIFNRTRFELTSCNWHCSLFAVHTSTRFFSLSRLEGFSGVQY